jgi:hypothetical protein
MKYVSPGVTGLVPVTTPPLPPRDPQEPLPDAPAAVIVIEDTPFGTVNVCIPPV